MQEMSINCDFSNERFTEMVFSLKIMVEYAIYLIEGKKPKEYFLFYNYVFERYLPVETFNLGSIDYGKLFIGRHSVQFIKMYKELLSLWMVLQNKWSFDEMDRQKLRDILRTLTELTKLMS